MKQLALGSFMYAGDNSQHAGVESPAFPGGNWMGTLHEYASAKGILICPSAPVHQPPPASGNEQGYADRAWVRWTSDKKTMFSGSFGYNGYLYSDARFSEPGEPRQQQANQLKRVPLGSLQRLRKLCGIFLRIRLHGPAASNGRVVCHPFERLVLHGAQEIPGVLLIELADSHSNVRRQGKDLVPGLKTDQDRPDKS